MAELEAKAVLKGHTDRVWCLDWSPCGKILASSGADKRVKIWTQGPGGEWTCQAEVEEGHTRTVRSLAWSPGGDKLATASFDGTCIVWTFKDLELEQLCTLQGHENEVKSVSWDPSGRLLATCSRDKSVWVWECADEEDDYECVAVLHGHSQDVKMVSWHPSKEVLISASYDESVKVWQADEDDWACSQTVAAHSDTVWGVSCNGGGDRLVTVGADMKVKFWRDEEAPGAAGARYACEMTLEGTHSRQIYSVDWCKDRHAVATSGADDAINVLTMGGGDKGEWGVSLTKKGAHVGDVNCVRWRPGEGGRELASAGDDGLIVVWAVPL